jgi:dTDP-4-dehydrorhamnose 3,5-epimerase
MGAVYDVLLDLRPESPTHSKWIAIELSARNRLALYVPFGVAHGFLTLQDNSEVYYQMSSFFHPESARGVRWNDPSFSISWPAPVHIMSERDKNYPDYALVSLPH